MDWPADYRIFRYSLAAVSRNCGHIAEDAGQCTAPAPGIPVTIVLDDGAIAFTRLCALQAQRRVSY